MAAFGRQFAVEMEGKIHTCMRRGKKNDVVVGDIVNVDPTASVIEAIAPRTSLLYRSDAYREKRIAANLTQIIIVLAAIPSFSEELLNLCLIAAEDQGLQSLILLNKADMIDATAHASKILDTYRELGHSVLTLSAKQDISALLPFLMGQTSVLVGQSGMGKSTLINALVPDAMRETAEISSALDSGRHTTTHARLFHLSEHSHIIDSPGLQEFGLHHLDPDRLAHAFPEFRPYLGHCRFRNCRHLDEPDCAIAAAFESGRINVKRLAVYRKLAARLYLPKFRKGLNDR